MEHLGAKEPNVSFRSWRRPKTELEWRVNIELTVTEMAINMTSKNVL